MKSCATSFNRTILCRSAIAQISRQFAALKLTVTVLFDFRKLEHYGGHRYFQDIGCSDDNLFAISIFDESLQNVSIHTFDGYLRLVALSEVGCEHCFEVVTFCA